MSTSFQFFHHIKLAAKIFLMSLIFTILMIYGNVMSPGQAKPNSINSWSECPPQSDTIWVQLDEFHSPTGAENVIQIPFDSGTVQIGNYEYDNYIRGVLAGEVSTATEPDGTTVQFDDETLKAMAVAIRTKVFHMCGNATHDYFPDNDGVMRRGIRGQVIQDYQYNKALANYTEAERQRYQGTVDVTDEEYLVYNNNTFDIIYRNISVDPTNGSAAPHLSVADPTGSAHTGLSQTGLPQFNADHWARGNSHGASYPQWNYRQILTHYYTQVHLKNGSGAQLTPAYRWNPLTVDWGSGAISPPKMLQGQSYPVSVRVQNSGTANWTSTANVRLSCRWLKPDSTWVNCSANSAKIIHTPGDETPIPITLSVTPDAGFADGTYTLQLDAKQNGVFFATKESSRPWYTLDYRVCVGQKGCQIFLPLILKNWPPVYLFETFGAGQNGWIFYTIPSSGQVSDYVYIHTDGHTDGNSLFIGEGNGYDAGAKKYVAVPPGSSPKLSLWCKQAPGGTPGYSRYYIYINGHSLSSPAACYSNWHEKSVTIPSDYTASGQILLDLRVFNYPASVRSYSLFDDIKISLE